MPPTADSDDDWAELARELSRDRPQPPVEQPPTTEEMGLFGENAEDLPPPLDQGEALPEFAGESPAEGPPDGQPGIGRKRRRRRRRRRRGSGEQPAEATAADESEADETPDQPEAGPSEAGYADDEETDSDFVPADADPTSDEEDAGEELLRDLIANWNVPSWDDVVAGLYRPER